MPHENLAKVGENSDNGNVAGWLEAMKASSPPRVNYLNHELNTEYHDWIMKHPSALDKFEEIIRAARGKRLAVFLDYDGTLSPIVEDPDQAFMSEEMRIAVKKVATCFPTAIITGRRRDKVYQFVQLPELFYAGSHGMDIVGPADGSQHQKEGEAICFQPASEFLTVMNEVCKELVERAKQVEGAKVEHNKFCITVHFRCVDEEKWELLAEIVQKILLKYQELSLIKGRKVLEIRPSIEWGKGKALEFLLTALGLEKNSVPIYIGDDRTDEDAFNVLKRLGFGCSILVSAVPKSTSASYSLQDPSEVLMFLNCLADSKTRIE